MSLREAVFASTFRAVVMLGALGCGSKGAVPPTTPSTSQVSYAANYPAALQTTSNAYVNTERDARRLTTDFAKYPEQLKDPPWPIVHTIVSRADEAGRSVSYVEARRSADANESFFASENNEITRRVAGSAQYVIKKKECDVDVSGAVAASLKEAVDKQLEKDLRARSDAHLTIERYRESLGKANAAALEKHADDISFASYLAHIRTVELKTEALRLVEEAKAVRRTLEQSTAEERSFQAEPGRSAAERKASSDRVVKMQDALVRIDAALPHLLALNQQIDQRNEGVRAEYVRAFDNLIKAIAVKASAR